MEKNKKKEVSLIAIPVEKIREWLLSILKSEKNENKRSGSTALDMKKKGYPPLSTAEFE